MAEDYQFTLQDYVSILKRRAVLLIITFSVLFSIAVVVAVAWPPVYESAGVILVESQQIPADLVPSTVTSYAGERIELIKQRVMVRDNILRIIDKFGIFGDDRQSTPVSELVDAMNKKVGVEVVNANVQNKRQQNVTVISFRLSFQDKNPNLAHRVANELVTLFLDENVKVRTARASETTEFLKQEAEKLRLDLVNLEGQVAKYKQDNANALPEHLSLHMDMLARVDSSLKELERDFKTTQSELRFLDVELAAVQSGALTPAGAASAQDPAQQLANLKAEYAQLTGLYKENHPSVRAVKRKIDVLEAKLSDPASGGDQAKKVASSAAVTTNLAKAQVQAKIEAANARLTSLVQQQKTLQERRAELERQIEKTPQVEMGLAALLRDHENAQKKYEEVRAKQMSAKLAENLEEEQKAERFVLLEPPALPDKPVKPDRVKVLLGGLAGSVGGSGGLVFVLEMLNQRIRGADALTALLRQPPLQVIPYMTSRQELEDRRRRIKKLLAIASIVAVLVLILVHVFYMPLGMLAMKVIARFE